MSDAKAETTAISNAPLTDEADVVVTREMPLDRPRRRGLVIMPAFNESGSVAAVVKDLQQHLDDFDVLVIDDGSTDGTASHVPATARVIRLPFNLGIGGAMQTGYRFAALHGYELAVQVDADGQHPPNQIHKLLAAMEAHGADVVIGSRFKEAVEYRQTAARMTGIRMLRSLLKLLTGQTFTDCTSGFRLVNRQVIAAYAHFYPDDYPEPEVCLLLHRAGFRIVDTQTQMRERTTGQTSIPLMRGLFYVAKVSAALLLDMVRDPWPAPLLPTRGNEARLHDGDRAEGKA